MVAYYQRVTLEFNIHNYIISFMQKSPAQFLYNIREVLKGSLKIIQLSVAYASVYFKNCFVL